MAPGSTDPHYTVLENGNSAAFVVNNQAPGPYVQSLNSRWIWQQANGLPGSVTRTFRQTFNLTGFDPASAVITGQYAADNRATIQLNGVVVGPSSPGFTAFTSFTINSNFVAGVNTLDFVAVDEGAPGGLNVTGLQLTARQSALDAPEPAALLLALPALLLVARRRR